MGRMASSRLYISYVLMFLCSQNGMPSMEKPYVFNGDFVDRGKDSVEILLILFAFLLVYPSDVHLNRGNHEDHICKLETFMILKLLQMIFRWLPLATVIDHKVLILHGGISDTTDLSLIAKMDRHRVSGSEEPHSVVDLLWSDPMSQEGCIPNEGRGGGCYWGPDVTEQVLSKHHLQLLIRSHECKQEGYEFCHNRKVLTLFSASNYYEVGSNRGAYVTLGSDLAPHLVQYQASNTTRELTLKQRLKRNF
uniref:Serine/threonine-protein phosphatase n=1 Tax=Paramormyrops kingsleyae TaxID=1676925 RepID=A0A3B3QSY1_9TELE